MTTAALVFEDRESDSPLVERVWRSRSEGAGTFLSVAQPHCAGDPWFLFPVFLGVLAWAGLWCRSDRIRELLPLVS